MRWLRGAVKPVNFSELSEGERGEGLENAVASLREAISREEGQKFCCGDNSSPGEFCPLAKLCFR